MKVIQFKRDNYKELQEATNNRIGIPFILPGYGRYETVWYCFIPTGEFNPKLITENDFVIIYDDGSISVVSPFQYLFHNDEINKPEEV